MTGTELIIAVGAAFLGALFSGMIGWWDSHEPFDARKFMGNVSRAVFAAMAFVSTNELIEVKGAIWLWAFLGGAGIDVLGNRLQGGIKGKTNDMTAQVSNLSLQVKSITDILQGLKEKIDLLNKEH